MFTRLSVSLFPPEWYAREMGTRVLIVDDEPEFAELLQYRLAGDNYEFSTATNSTDALNHAWDHPPDLILLDLLLPDLDGLSVCEMPTIPPRNTSRSS
jgi:DNA-binding response OmpR family regulator